jgi:hypothetical protein
MVILASALMLTFRLNVDTSKAREEERTVILFETAAD